MAKIKYDVSDVEAGGGGEQPQPGLYRGKIVSIKNRKAKADGSPTNDLEVVVDVGEQYSRLWTYIQLDNPATRWKLREFTDALGLPPKGEIDEKKHEGKPVTVKITSDTDLDGDYRGRIKNLFLPGEAPGEEEDLVESGSSDEEPWTEDDLKALSVEELKTELAAFEITLAGRFSKDKAIEAILEAQENEPEAEPEDEPTASSNGALADIDEALLEDLNDDPDYYEEWTTEDLSGYADDLGIAGNISGRKTKAKIIEAIVALAASAGNGDGESGETTDDYDEWEDHELSEEIDTRIEAGAEIEVKGRKTRDKLISALRADDKVAEPF